MNTDATGNVLCLCSQLLLCSSHLIVPEILGTSRASKKTQVSTPNIFYGQRKQYIKT